MTIWADKDRRKMLFAVFLHPIGASRRSLKFPRRYMCIIARTKLWHSEVRSGVALA